LTDDSKKLTLRSSSGLGDPRQKRKRQLKTLTKDYKAKKRMVTENMLETSTRPQPNEKAKKKRLERYINLAPESKESSEKGGSGGAKAFLFKSSKKGGQSQLQRKGKAPKTTEKFLPGRKKPTCSRIRQWDLRAY